jgi:predicted O-methyltransferase YrrM
METIESIRSGGPTRFAELLQKIRAAGTDNLSFFGGGYEKEGGYSLQQNPEEFAALVGYIEAVARKGSTYLEIGTASGGVCRFLHAELGFHRVIVIDDHGHHRWTEQAEHLGAVKRALGPEDYAEHIGDSHAQAAVDFLDQQCSVVHAGHALDIAFVDGDHTYEGVTADLKLVRPGMRHYGLVILHDIVACEGVKRAWKELHWCDKVAEFVGPGRPLGIGVGRVR